MNKQGPGKIEWTDYTWSPVTGCRFGCEYGPRGCYANQIAQRIYPEKFEPTYRPERLKDKDLGRVPDGNMIFVCDMGDLFGDWVPDKWINEILKVTRSYPQYIYQFLTKNPERYLHWFDEFPPNSWLGTTIDYEKHYLKRSEPFWQLDNNSKFIKFVSFEPILSSMPLDSAFDWVIIGERTGNWASNEELRLAEVWTCQILEQTRVLNIPVFVKNRLYEKFPIREFPKLKGD